MEESDVLETTPISWPALIVAALVPCCCLGYCLDTDEDEIESVDEVLTVPERVQRIESLISSHNYPGARTQLDTLAGQSGVDPARVERLSARLESSRERWVEAREREKVVNLTARLGRAVDARDPAELKAVVSDERFEAMAATDAYEALSLEKLAVLTDAWKEPLPKNREELAILCTRRSRLVEALTGAFGKSRHAQAWAGLTTTCDEAVAKRPVKPGFIGRSVAYLMTMRPRGVREARWVSYTSDPRYVLYAYFGRVEQGGSVDAAKIKAVYITRWRKPSGERPGLDEDVVRELVETFTGGTISPKKLERRGERIEHRRTRAGGQRVEVGFHGSDVIEVTLGKLSLRSKK